MGTSHSKKKKQCYRPIIVYNLKAHEIPHIDEGYYNLGTNRKNKDKRTELIYDENYKVGGTVEEMREFYRINHITENTVCKLNVENSVLYAPNVDDVAKIPVTMIDALQPFSLSGLRTKARVVEVIDGDTIYCVLYLPLKFLFEPKYYQHERKSIEEKSSQKHMKQAALLKSSKPTSKKIQEGGLFLKFDCRLLNMDAAEHDTQQGILATKLTKDLYESLGNIVYIDCYGFDKYGRLLIDIYADESYSKYLNFYLIEHPDPKLGVLAMKYDGQTKSDYMKNLPTV